MTTGPLAPAAAGAADGDALTRFVAGIGDADRTFLDAALLEPAHVRPGWTTTRRSARGRRRRSHRRSRQPAARYRLVGPRRAAATRRRASPTVAAASAGTSSTHVMRLGAERGGEQGRRRGDRVQRRRRAVVRRPRLRARGDATRPRPRCWGPLPGSRRADDVGRLGRRGRRSRTTRTLPDERRVPTRPSPASPSWRRRRGPTAPSWNCSPPSPVRRCSTPALLPDDVDGLLVAPAMAGAPLTQPAMVAEYLGLTPTYCDLVDLGGATAAGMVWRAAAAIAAGACRHVLCVLAETIGPWASGPDVLARPAAQRGRGDLRPVRGDVGLRPRRRPPRRRVRHHRRAARRRARRAAAQRRRQRPRAVPGPDRRSPRSWRRRWSPRHYGCSRSSGSVSGAVAFVVSAGDIVARPTTRRDAGCTASASGSPTTAIGQMADLTHTPVSRHRPPRLRHGRRRPGRRRRRRGVRLLHDHRHPHARGRRLLRQGRGWRVRRAGRLRAWLHRCRSTPTAASCAWAKPGSPAGPPTSCRPCASSAAPPVRVQVPGCEVAFVNGNGGLFSEQCSLVLGSERR